MKSINRYIRSITAICLAVMLFSCEDRLHKVRDLEAKVRAPQTEGEGVNLFYTDSGKVQANLRAKKLLDYTNLPYAYREFPEGLTLHFFDENQQKNTVVADYGVEYSQAQLVDLRGNVKVVTSDSTILTGKQLYWDQQNQWVFTDQAYTVKLKNGTINNGQGFDANKSFDKFISRYNVGMQVVKESDTVVKKPNK
ncbi:MAG: LPS export ABC transporter periplasmic protein LptC [Mesonia hippocampi]|uniref:LPS export ABC transporter periplasmic protein LptC n=1 Tax=Mesonia hippocampi TaxID=1628250 RepID=UPI003F9A937A